jgi:hypothetical protein
MRLDVISTVNDPGVPGKTGDDRAGFDAAAGTAWVLDGATDVTDLRPFPACESGAAWIAEALSDRLMQGPESGEDAGSLFRLRAGRCAPARRSRKQDPAGQIAGRGSAHRVRHLDAGCRAARRLFVFMGDCMALVRSAAGVRLIGQAEKAEDETATARRVLALTPEERMGWLRQARRMSNEIGTAFGLGPDVVSNLKTARIAMRPGDEVCLMSDGSTGSSRPMRPTR